MSTKLLNKGAASSPGNDFLSLFRQAGKLEHCLPGTELFRQEQSIRDIYLIESGAVKFTRATNRGREMLVTLRSEGDLLGAASVISHNLSSVTATTVTECRIRRLSTEAFLKLEETDREFSRALLRAISRQFYQQTARLAWLGTSKSLARVAHLLLQLVPESASKQAGEARLQLPMKHVDLAKMLAMSPEHFSRMLSKLEEMGIIRRSKGWICVRDLKRLAEEAD